MLLALTRSEGAARCTSTPWHAPHVEGRVNGSRDSRLRASVGPVARPSRLRVCAVRFQRGQADQDVERTARLMSWNADGENRSAQVSW